MTGEIVSLNEKIDNCELLDRPKNHDGLSEPYRERIEREQVKLLIREAIEGLKKEVEDNPSITPTPKMIIKNMIERWFGK